MKQKIKNILAICVLAVVSFACGSSGPPPRQVVLNVWMPFETSQNFQPFIDDYTKLHPNVQVVYTMKDVTTYEQDLLDALASGSGPDIFSINNSWLPEYADKATAAPASVLDVKDYQDTFVDVAAKDLIKDGQVYGVPLSVDSLALYYNKDLLGTAGIATPPKTWDELATDVQKIKKQDQYGYFTRSGVAIGTNANVNRGVDVLYLFMLQQGAMPFSSDGLQPTFDQEITKNGEQYNPADAALDYYTSFASPFSPNYNWNSKSDYSIDAFVNGKAAFLFSYSYTEATIAQKAPNLNYGVTGVPQPNLDDPAVNFANYWGEVVSKQSKNADYAWDFLKFISSKDELDKLYAREKQPASRKDLIPLQISDPDIGVFANANLTAKSFYKPDQTKMDNIFGEMIDNVILKGEAVPDAVTQGVQEAATLTQQ